jgi:hypothetical protein
MGSICTYGVSTWFTVTPAADVSCEGVNDCAVAVVALASVRLLAVMDTVTTTLACQALINHGRRSALHDVDVI